MKRLPIELFRKSLAALLDFDDEPEEEIEEGEFYYAFHQLDGTVGLLRLPSPEEHALQ